MKNDKQEDVSSKEQTDPIETKSQQPKVVRDGVDPGLKILQVLTPLNLRAKPEMSAEIFLVMKKGSTVHEVSFNDGWSFVRTESGREGWAMKEYLKEI